MSSESWKIEGDYFEACNCDTVCPCVFLADPDQGECDASVAWHIEKGHFNNNQLDGLNAAAIFHAPGNLMTGPKWKIALYVDERASKEQSDAIVKIFSGQAGGFFGVLADRIGELAGVRSVPINFVKEGKRRSVTIPSTLEVSVEGIAGENQGRDVVIVNPPLKIAQGYDPIVSKSTMHNYSDHGMKWENKGKSAFHSRFAYLA